MMNKFTLNTRGLYSLSLGLFLVVTSGSAAFASQTSHRTVAVSGSAEVKVVPDAVIVSLTAAHRGENLLNTQNENDEVISKYLRYLRKKIKIKSKNLQTNHHTVSPQFNYCSGAEERSGTCDPLKIRFYRVEKSLQIRLDDPKKYETVIRKAFEMGISRVNGVQFVSTELRKHRDEARRLATIAAKEKASAATDTLGMKLLKPISINVSESRFGSARSMMNNTIQNRMSMQSSEGGSEGLALGQISISAEVRVTFEME